MPGCNPHLAFVHCAPIPALYAYCRQRLDINVNPVGFEDRDAEDKVYIFERVATTREGNLGFPQRLLPVAHRVR